MEALFVIIAICIALGKYAAKHASQEAKDFAAEKAAGTPKTSEETSPIRAVRAQKRQPVSVSEAPQRRRESMQRAEQWAAAKRQQDDAQQLHSIKMDTCESKLESLRVLYDAGILDREEYATRVARVKAKHHEA